MNITPLLNSNSDSDIADLYERGIRLGKWGVAEESYESQIRSYIANSDGAPGHRVSFAGRLGAEKIPILQRTQVGVINPSGRSEICPVSALELQACSTPVVSTPTHGVVDTVISSETGLLGRGERALRRNLIYLLRHPDVAQRYGVNGSSFVRKHFSYDVVMAKWHELLRAVIAGRPPQLQPARHLLRNGKFLREATRLARDWLSLPLPSTVEIRDRIKHRRRQ